MDYLDDLDRPQVTSSDACRAAGIDQATLKNWLSRDPPIMPVSDRHLVGGRTVFLFPIRRVHLLAIVADLVRGRIAPKQAVEWAMRFTEASGTAKGIRGGLVQRLSGHPFPDLATYLVANGERCQVVGVDPIDPIALTRAMGAGTNVLLELGPIINRVRETLGLEPYGPLHAQVPRPPDPPKSMAEAQARPAAAKVQLERD